MSFTLGFEQMRLYVQIIKALFFSSRAVTLMWSQTNICYFSGFLGSSPSFMLSKYPYWRNAFLIYSFFASACGCQLVFDVKHLWRTLGVRPTRMPRRQTAWSFSCRHVISVDAPYSLPYAWRVYCILCCFSVWSVAFATLFDYNIRRFYIQ